ncbi:MAG: glycoside hydrolase family 31 protein, partial [Clostridia bacterium]|nr:glycoside hydrolase family 31 protein [Clostridia bacterium]
MANQIEITMLPGECWYGLAADRGTSMPLDESSVFSLDITYNPTNNQVSPVLFSSKGRYIYSDKGFALKAEGGVITVSGPAPILTGKEGDNLREVFLTIAKRCFPSDGIVPPKEFFAVPQYNTWIELIYDQNQADILRYAHGIIDNGYPAGVFMIDDNWQRDYGCWEFRAERFPDPKAMMDELHALGFRVMMWICPYISADSEEFRYLRGKNLLAKSKDGEISLHKWWNGFSATIDLMNPEAVDWFRGRMQYLQDTYGVDGFKLDAGDAFYYRNDRSEHNPEADANDYCVKWAELGLSFAYNEYRACFSCQGKPLVQRLCDKSHAWGANGMATLVPNTLTQGIMGYAYTCPDMIGGGSYSFFLAENLKEILDEELVVRYAQCAALMPMMQFSAAPWRVLSAENAEICQKMAMLHTKYGDYILSLAAHAAETGEPAARYMEYEFSGEGMEKICDQFMLGDKVLVAPVFVKGQTERAVVLPKGRWQYCDGTVYEGGTTVTVPAPLSVLPYFE